MDLTHFGGFANDDSSFCSELAVVEPEFIEYLQSYAQSSPLSHNKTISITLVVDANIIYAEIYGRMNGKPPYLANFSMNPILELYAPETIDTEVAETIDKDLPAKFDKTKAKQIATELLARVKKIKVDKTDICYHEAYKLIGARDKSGPTDAQYLGVAFLFKTHGVISKDNIFNNQSEIKVWKIGEVGKVVSELTNGSLSLFILENGIKSVASALYYVASAVLRLTMQIFEGLVTIAISVVKDGVKFLSNLPDEVKKALMIGGIALGLLYLASTQFRDIVSEGFDQIKKTAFELVKEVRTALIMIVENLGKIMCELGPLVAYSENAIGYMLYSINQLNSRLTELEKSQYTNYQSS